MRAARLFLKGKVESMAGSEGRGGRLIRGALLAGAIALLAYAGYILVGDELTESGYRGLSDELVAVGDDAGVDWDALAAVNPDIAAWIKVDGTPIDYPVVEPGPDKADGWYLYHDFWGESASAGCPYVDTRTKADEPHALVYGHRMGWSGKMFGSLWNDSTRSVRRYGPRPQAAAWRWSRSAR